MERDQSVSLGFDVARGSARFLSVADRARHTYAIGKTGSGKTTFLRSIALQDIRAGRGVCLIDLHGDIVQAVADSIPRNRVNDTVYFDAGDRQHPIGFNPLAGCTDADTAELLASESLAMFKGLFADSWGEWLEYLLKNTLLSLLSQRTVPVSLLSVQRMLEEDTYRKRVIKQVKDPVLRGFWDNYFLELSKRVELDRISSTLNKTGKFVLSPVLRNIVGQLRSGFDITRVMDSKQILLVNLSKGRIGSDNANFLGSLLMSKIISTVLRRSEQPEHERVPFGLIVDEFQNVTTNEITTIMSEARKYALHITLAHQNCDQIPSDTLGQIQKDAGTIAVFKVAFGDGDLLEKALRPVLASELASSSDGEFWVRTGAQEPALIHGYSPDDLDHFRTQSFPRVVANSRWRFSRPRDAVERDFAGWYGGGC